MSGTKKAADTAAAETPSETANAADATTEAPAASGSDQGAAPAEAVPATAAEAASDSVPEAEGASAGDPDVAPVATMAALDDKEMAEFLIYNVMQAPRSRITGVLSDDLKAKVNQAVAAGYVEEVESVGMGRYTRGYQLTQAGREFGVKNIG